MRFDPRSLLDPPAAWGEKPLDQPIPKFTLPGQQAAPCNAEVGERTINGNCWVWIADVKPPCGILFRQGDKCYRAVAVGTVKPTADFIEHQKQRGLGVLQYISRFGLKPGRLLDLGCHGGPQSYT